MRFIWTLLAVSATFAAQVWIVTATAHTIGEPLCAPCRRASPDLTVNIRQKMMDERISYTDLGSRDGVVTIRVIDANREGDMKRALNSLNMGGKRFTVAEPETGHFLIYPRRP